MVLKKAGNYGASSQITTQKLARKS